MYVSGVFVVYPMETPLYATRLIIIHDDCALFQPKNLFSNRNCNIWFNPK